MEKARNVLAVGLAIGAAATFAACGGKEEVNASGTNAVAGCDVGAIANLSANPAKFDQSAFLPRTPDGIDNASEAEAVINADKLFVEDDTINTPALAAVMSAITTPSSDSKVTGTSYNYVAQFDSKMAEYKAGDGSLEVAKDDCVSTIETLKQTGEFTEDWAGTGDKVVQISAVRNSNNKIYDMKLEKQVTKEPLSGVAFKVRPTSGEEIDGFNEVLLTADGEMFVKGVTVEEQAKKQEKENKGKSAKNGKSQGQSRSGSNGGGGSGTGNGTGGGKGGQEGGGCGGSCGSGNNGGNGGGGNGGGGGGGCSSCGGGGGGGGGNPTTPGNPGGGGGNPNPEPEPEPEPNKGTETPTPDVPAGY